MCDPLTPTPLSVSIFQASGHLDASRNSQQSSGSSLRRHLAAFATPGGARKDREEEEEEDLNGKVKWLLNSWVVGGLKWVKKMGKCVMF